MYIWKILFHRLCSNFWMYFVGFKETLPCSWPNQQLHIHCEQPSLVLSPFQFNACFGRLITSIIRISWCTPSITHFHKNLQYLWFCESVILPQYFKLRTISLWPHTSWHRGYENLEFWRCFLQLAASLIWFHFLYSQGGVNTNPFFEISKFKTDNWLFFSLCMLVDHSSCTCSSYGGAASLVSYHHNSWYDQFWKWN